MNTKLRSFFPILSILVYPPDKLSNRVVGGKDASEGEAPYQCSLQMNQKHFCGCLIISERWILSAAHCLDHTSAQYVDVLVGTNDLKNGGKYYKAKKFILHENFNKPQYAYDIGLIKVNETIEFNALVQPIEPSSEDADLIPKDADLRLSGWGLKMVSTFTADQLIFSSIRFARFTLHKLNAFS